MEWASDAYFLSVADEANYNDIVVTIESVEVKNLVKAKQASTTTATAETLETIADDCDNILAFLKAVAMKSP